MSKIYKGYELIKAIEERKIKENSLFKNELGTYIYLSETLWYYNTLHKTTTEEVGNSMMINNTFELIEEGQDIDIQGIEEIEWNEINGVGEEQDRFILKNGKYICNNYNDFEMIILLKINQLIKIVKQLDRKIKKGGINI